MMVIITDARASKDIMMVTLQDADITNGAVMGPKGAVLPGNINFLHVFCCEIYRSTVLGVWLGQTGLSQWFVLVSLNCTIEMTAWLVLEPNLHPGIALSETDAKPVDDSLKIQEFDKDLDIPCTGCMIVRNSEC